MFAFGPAYSQLAHSSLVRRRSHSSRLVGLGPLQIIRRTRQAEPRTGRREYTGLVN